MKPGRANQATDSGRAVRFSVSRLPKVVIPASWPSSDCPLCHRQGTQDVAYAVNNVGEVEILVLFTFCACQRCAGRIERKSPATVKKLRRKLWPLALDLAHDAVDAIILEEGERRASA